MANLTNAANSGFNVKVTTTTPYSITFLIQGQFTSYTVIRNGTIITSTNQSSQTYTDTTVDPGTGYSYVFQSYVGAGANAATTVSAISADPPPPAPTITTASMETFSFGIKTATSVELLFSGSYNTYNIYRGSYIIHSGSYSETSFTDNGNNNTGLLPNTSYLYLIVPYTSTNSQGNNLQLTTYTLSNINGIYNTAVDTSSITLNIDGAYQSYTLSRNGSNIFTGASSNYRDINLTANTTYIYTISSTNALGESTPKAISWSFTTLPIINTVSTGILTATTIQFILTGSYKYVAVSRSDGVLNTVYDTSYTDTGLIANTLYTYIFTPYNATGNGTDVSLSTSTLPFVSTNVFNVTSYTSQSISLSFSGYYVSLKLYRSGILLDTLSSTTTSYVDSTVTPNQLYVYTLIPYNGLGQRGQSQSLQQNTLATLNYFFACTH